MILHRPGDVIRKADATLQPPAVPGVQTERASGRPPEHLTRLCRHVPRLEASTQLAGWIRDACRLEALARKPGNVHPGAAFADLAVRDFLESAEIVAPVLAESGRAGIGQCVLQSVRQTQAILGRNTNLGIVLLLAPLAAVPLEHTLADGIEHVLGQTTVEDARLVYRAIRAARPGGMGRAPEQDLACEPTLPLVEVMRLAADRDRIAAQYVSGFRDVLEFAVPELLQWSRQCDEWEQAVVGLHLTLMSQLPDTLIARKCGREIAGESARRAQAVLDAGWPVTSAGTETCSELDGWLRADGNRRNPGTTADLVAAALFAAMRDHNWRPTATP